MSVLVDTSVWIDHFRGSEPRLVDLLNDGAVAVHPHVIGELACGHLQNRDEILGHLQALPAVKVADHDEVLHFLSVHALHGSGLGWVDVHLLAAAKLTGVRLWSHDKTLAAVATRLGI